MNDRGSSLDFRRHSQGVEIRVIDKLFMILNDLVPKKPNKIAFLSIPDYSDNPRFLYEFMRQDQEDLEYIWIVNDREILQELIAKKIKAVRKNSIMGFFTLASSKVLIGDAQ